MAMAGKPVMFATGFKANQVSLGELQFRRVFDQQDPLVVGNELREHSRECRFFLSRFRRR